MARRFGVEIEFVYGRSGQREGKRLLLAELAARSIAAVDSSHTHVGHSSTAWTLKYDGSVSYGGEIVSPPLDFDSATDREQVNTVMEALQAAGCNSDEAAGVHVHVEASDLNARQIAAVARFCYKFEDALYRIGSSGWERIRSGASSYCQPIPDRLANEIMSVRDMQALNRVWIADRQRYRIVNIQAYGRQGTLEFRLFNSTLNPERVQAYIALSVAIVNDARQNFSRSTKKHFQLGYMLENGPAAEKSMLLKLQQILRYQSRMSAEDWKLLRKCWKDSRPQADIFRRWAA